MRDKELIKIALRATEAYSPNQYLILDELIDISVDNTVNASVKYLAENTEVKASTIYFALKVFQKDNLLFKVPQSSNFYKFNQEKLKFILEIYNNKKNQTKVD